MIPIEVAQIATEVRKWAEDNKTELGCSHLDLCGLCAVSSAELYRRIKRYDPNIDVVLAYAEDGCFGHVFVVYNRTTIIDLTATQFFDEIENDTVTIKPISQLNPWYWKVRRIFLSDRQLHEFQVTDGWTVWQQANHHLKQKRKSNELKR